MTNWLELKYQREKRNYERENEGLEYYLTLDDYIKIYIDIELELLKEPNLFKIACKKQLDILKDFFKTKDFLLEYTIEKESSFVYQIKLLLFNDSLTKPIGYNFLISNKIPTKYISESMTKVLDNIINFIKNESYKLYVLKFLGGRLL